MIPYCLLQRRAREDIALTKLEDFCIAKGLNLQIMYLRDIWFVEVFDPDIFCDEYPEGTMQVYGRGENLACILEDVLDRTKIYVEVKSAEVKV